MRILVGCEESGKVRDAFIKYGHDAWSNDIIPSRVDNSHHYQMDVKECIVYCGPWDVIILHPDCTAMALSGNGTYGSGKAKHHLRLQAVNWTIDLWDLAKQTAKIGCVIENPMSVLWSYIGKPQYIQPWMFGHGETKATGILTFNLPLLKPTNIVEGREPRIWRMPPSPNRKRDRSETFTGIAEAMAVQWGGVCL